MVPTVPVVSHPTRQSHERDSSSVLSHGRGGAGNMAAGENEQEDEQDIRIPILKSPVYTTGRGGSGNMALNDLENPEKARRAQDIEEPIRISNSSEFHGGRGGAGNIVNSDDVDAALAREEAEKQKLAGKRPEPVDHTKCDYRGWADRGKDMLFGRKKKT